jgi:hypothetical protein
MNALIRYRYNTMHAESPNGGYSEPREGLRPWRGLLQ